MVRPAEAEPGDDADKAVPADAAAAKRKQPLELSLCITGGPDGGSDADANNGGRLSGRRRDMALSALQLLDADGNAWAYAGNGPGGGWDGTTLRVTRRFRPGDDTGPPARLRWELPARVRVVPVDFEFRDVPLPKLD